MIIHLYTTLHYELAWHLCILSIHRCFNHSCRKLTDIEQTNQMPKITILTSLMVQNISQIRLPQWLLRGIITRKQHSRLAQQLYDANRMPFALFKVSTLSRDCWGFAWEKVQVGKDQEKAQSEKDSHSKNRGGEKTN